MFRSRWLRNLWNVARSHKDGRRPATRGCKPVRLMLEPLEDRITPSGFQTLYSFTGGSDGMNPQGGVILDSSGNLYGTAALGGQGRGTLFEIDSTSKFTTLYSFTATGGNNPLDPPIRDSNGNLFGTTNTGGTNLNGTVFEYDANGTYTTLHSFALGTDGEKPVAGLIMDKQGDLFGTTSLDSANGGGSVFELSPNGSGGYNFTTLYSFSAGQIYSGVVMDSAGNLYGTTLTGGTSNVGVVYKLSPDGSGGYTYSTLHNFAGGNDGGNPIGGLVLDGSGNLYGTTFGFGAGGQGTVFKLSTDGSSFSTLYSFAANGSDGAQPEDALFIDSKGDLYGTTNQGGASNGGVVFELSPNGSGSYADTTLHSFGGSDGANPYAGLVTDGNGNLYGTTISGGSDSDGTIFELTGVLPAPTTTTASNVTATFSTNTQNVMLTANVTNNSATVNEGTVTFTIQQGSTVIGAATTSDTVSNGQASVSYALPAGLAAGTYSIDAVYNPGPDFIDSSDTTHTLTVQVAPAVTTNPGNQTVTAGQNATFTAAANANPAATVQWQASTDGGKTWTDISGATSTSLTLSDVQASQNGDEYQAVFTNSLGSAATTAATLTVQFAPTVTSNPSNQTVTAGQNATFTAAANANPAATVQWQASSDGGKTWTDIGGATSTTLTLSNVQVSQNGYEYQAVFTNSVGFAITSVATLTVDYAPIVTTNPSNQTVNAGQNISFTAAANGNPAATVQWQVSSDGGKTFTDISGATSVSLTLTNVTADMNGNEYQAVFTNSVSSAPTTAATLTVQFAPTVASNPSNQTVTAGQNATFTAAANGNPAATVQWQVSTDGGKTFTDISGATSVSLTLNAVTAAMNGDEYQAVFTNSLGTATTNAATLTVQYAPVVTTAPSSQTVTAGQNTTFTVTADGNPAPTVQWQVSSDGGSTWSNINGATSTTLILSNIQASQNGYQYQAVFTNSIGTITTTTATLTVQFPPSITTNPSNQTVTAGTTATFTAVANGNPSPTAQWQVSSDRGKTWTDLSGATATTLTLNNVLFSQNGNEYRAIFTNSVDSNTTTAATLTVQTPPTISSGNSAAFTIGQGGSFTLTATGSPTPTFTESGALPNGLTFTDNGNGTATLDGVLAAGTQGTYHFTITAHNGIGSDFTQSFTLTVNPAPVPPSPPHQAPVLNVPPLLALFDSLLGGRTETINANGTETVVDSLFGISLVVATYDGSGNFVSATLLGINVPNWVWSL